MARPLFPLRSLLPRRRMIHNTIMTAGPGGAENPLPGSPAAKENEILSRLTGNTLLTNANIVAPPPSAQRKPRGRLGQPQPPLVSHARGIGPADQNNVRVGVDAAGREDTAPGKAGSKPVDNKIDVSDKNNDNRNTVERKTNQQMPPILRVDQLKKKFPLDLKLMRREGQTQLIEETLQIIEGKRNGFSGAINNPEIGKFVFVGGHLIKRDIADFVARAIQAKSKEEILKLRDEIRNSKSLELTKLSKPWTELQRRALLGMLNDSLNQGPISRQLSPRGLRSRLGNTFKALDERIALGKEGGGDADSDTIIIDPSDLPGKDKNKK